MSLINVNNGVRDPFYRYKMPKVQIKVEGNGKGAKTVVVNTTEIAKALDRPPMYLTKYLGYTLCVQVNHDTRTDRHIVSGVHTSNKIQGLFYGFIQKYVLCPECKNPETDLSEKKNSITITCRACGNRGAVRVIDKISTYILKSLQAIPEDHGADIDTACAAGPEQSTAAKLRILSDFVKRRKDRVDITEEVIGESKRLEIGSRASMALCEGLFDENVLEQLRRHRILIIRFLIDDTKAQKYFLHGIESVIARYDLLTKVPHIMKAIYELFYIISDDVFFKWGSKRSNKFVEDELATAIRERAASFLAWLGETDEEESESGDDDGLIEFQNHKTLA